MNPDVEYRSCAAPQQADTESDDDASPPAAALGALGDGLYALGRSAARPSLCHPHPHACPVTFILSLSPRRRYAVEELIKQRCVKKRGKRVREFFVKCVGCPKRVDLSPSLTLALALTLDRWVGYKMSASTWEPEENIFDKSLIAAFEARGNCPPCSTMGCSLPDRHEGCARSPHSASAAPVRQADEDGQGPEVSQRQPAPGQSKKRAAPSHSCTGSSVSIHPPRRDEPASWRRALVPERMPSMEAAAAPAAGAAAESTERARRHGGRGSPSHPRSVRPPHHAALRPPARHPPRSAHSGAQADLAVYSGRCQRAVVAIDGDATRADRPEAHTRRCRVPMQGACLSRRPSRRRNVRPTACAARRRDGSQADGGAHARWWSERGSHDGTLSGAVRADASAADGDAASVDGDALAVNSGAVAMDDRGRGWVRVRGGAARHAARRCRCAAAVALRSICAASGGVLRPRARQPAVATT